MPPEMTPEAWQERLEYFQVEKDIAERHLTYAESQIVECKRHLGQVALQPEDVTVYPAPWQVDVILE